MIDFNKEIVAALNTILPTHYEMTLHAGIETPCISYMERNNSALETGDTLGYSSISYTIKVWGNDIAALQLYAKQIDITMRLLGFKRISSNELYDNQSTMIQKILGYEALAKEEF